MAYAEHRASAVLPNSGAFATAHAASRIALGVTKLGIRLRYTEHASATDGYPGFRVRWSLAGGDTALATVRSNSLTVSTTTATIKEYLAVVDCEDLTGAADVATVREIDVVPGAYAVKIEPAEIGDTANPGTLEILLEGIQ